jgi:hypothetical protein
VLEFVDIGPDLSLPGMVVNGGFAAGGAAGVEAQNEAWHGILHLKFDEDTSHFLDVFVLADQMLIAQQLSKAEFVGLALCLRPGVKRAIFSPQLLRGITRHPKRLFVGHSVCPGRSVKCSSQAKYLSRNREFPVRQTYGAIMLPSWRI